MSPQRVVLLLSSVIAVVVLFAVVCLLSGDRVLYIYEPQVADALVPARKWSPSLSPAAPAMKQEPSLHVTESARSNFAAPDVVARETTLGLLSARHEMSETLTESTTASYTPTSVIVSRYVKEGQHEPSFSAENTSLSEDSDASNYPDNAPNNGDEDVRSAAPTFVIRDGFNFPHPQVFLPVHTILNANWVRQLKDYLLSIHPAHSLTITVATKSFIPNLLNWLIAAHVLVQPPMQHVLVVGFDSDVHTLMVGREIPSIYVPISSVLKGNHRGVSTVWMTRFAVLRLLNHWGYNVMQLDNDAIPLKDPYLLYDAYTNYDIVSARGILPFELGRGPWGFTLCMGAVLLRATQKMGKRPQMVYLMCWFRVPYLSVETLWSAMHSMNMDKTTDDQKRINFALSKAQLHWKSKESHFDRANTGTSQDGLRVAVLPRKYICRKTCYFDVTDYFIWHMSGQGHSATWKSKFNAKASMWFLRPDYHQHSAGPDITGVQWLEWLTLSGSIRNTRQLLHPPQHVVPMIA